MQTTRYTQVSLVHGFMRLRNWEVWLKSDWVCMYCFIKLERVDVCICEVVIKKSYQIYETISVSQVFLCKCQFHDITCINLLLSLVRSSLFVFEILQSDCNLDRCIFHYMQIRCCMSKINNYSWLTTFSFKWFWG